MKKRHKLSLILFILIAFKITLFGQNQFGMKVSGGISRITKSIHGEGWGITPATPFNISGQVGCYCLIPLHFKSSLGAEILFSQIEGIEKEDGYLTPDGHSIVSAEEKLFRHVSYLSVPLYYGYTIKRLTFTGGIQISYAILKNGSYKSSGISYEETVSITSTLDDIHIGDVDYGPKACIIYNLNRRLAIEATYYYGLNNIYNGEIEAWEMNAQQMNVGIRYALLTKTDSKKIFKYAKINL